MGATPTHGWNKSLGTPSHSVESCSNLPSPPQDLLAALRHADEEINRLRAHAGVPAGEYPSWAAAEDTRKVLLEQGSQATGAPPHSDQIVWAGDDLNQSPSAFALLQTVPADFQESDELLRFFEGEQWDADTRSRWGKQGRPILTVNMLPRIYALAIDADSAFDLACDEEDERRLKCWIAHRNRDAQVFYNYAVSSAAERLAAQQGAHARLVSPVHAGDAAWAAYRRYSQIDRTTDELLDRDPAMWNSIAMEVIDYYLKQPKVPQ